MKQLNFYTGIAVLTALLFVTACDQISPESSNDAADITDEELELAAQIIGNSLSDQGEGFISSLYDAVSQVDKERISYERPDGSTGDIQRDETDRGDAQRQMDRSDSDPGHNRGRGSESDYHSSYNPETGEHTIRYHRKYSADDFRKSLKVHSVYIYTDINGRFLEYPRRQQDLIETIDFKGRREGTTESSARSNHFFRIDTLFLDGVSSATPILTIEGNHHGNGEMNVKLERRDIVTNRSYRVQFFLQDIRVDKAVVRENGSLEEGITGFISYRLYMSSTKNGETSERNLSGVIELTGDGHALLRFEKLHQFFRIALGSGTPHRASDDGTDRDKTRSTDGNR